MRELQLWVGRESVEQTFDEIAQLAIGCRYRDCSHAAEPGCRVASAERWQRIANCCVRPNGLMADGLAAREHKRKLKVMFRGLSRPKQAGAEVNGPLG